MRTDRLFGFQPTDETYRQRLLDLCEQCADLKMETSDAIEALTPEIERLGYSLNVKGAIDEWNSWEHLNSLLNEYAIMRDNAEDWDSREITADVFPAFQLRQTVPYKYDDARNWIERFVAAAQSVNWEGCSKIGCVALKTSPVWEALGNGVGGYEDWLGNPFPPFAFASNVDVSLVRADELHTYGLKRDR